MEKKQTVSENEMRLLRMAAQLGITFVDLKRDFAFKWAFGTPGHEDLLLLLLKGLLPEKHIEKVKLGPQEQQSDREDSQDGIFDILCETDDGSTLTIEMQVCPQPDFNDRMVFYSSFPIRNHVGQGGLSKNGQRQYGRYKLPPIYTIGILDFELKNINKSDRVIRHFSIREDEDEKTQFTDSVHYITVELPKFKKMLSELSTTQDYILYLIQNSGHMKEIPKEIKGKGFDKLLETCMFANMNEDMQMKYVRQMMAEMDRAGQLDYAVIAEREKNAKALKAEGISVSIISKCTGLTPEQIAML